MHRSANRFILEAKISQITPAQIPRFTDQQALKLLNTPFASLAEEERQGYRKQARQTAQWFIVGGVLVFFASVVIAGIWNELGLSFGIATSDRRDIGSFVPVIGLGIALQGIYRIMRNEHYAENLARQYFVSRHPELGFAYDELRERQGLAAQRQFRPYGILLLVLTIIGSVIFVAYATSQTLANR
ncbi:hypothetical protein H7097_02280 [Aeromicrobium sp.]|nr:hypothetical protein [Candidatus Saccharibacteria bacterium]